MFQWALWTRRDLEEEPLEKNIMFVQKETHSHQRHSFSKVARIYKVISNEKCILDIEFQVRGDKIRYFVLNGMLKSSKSSDIVRRPLNLKENLPSCFEITWEIFFKILWPSQNI